MQSRLSPAVFAASVLLLGVDATCSLGYSCCCFKATNGRFSSCECVQNEHGWFSDNNCKRDDGRQDVGWLSQTTSSGVCDTVPGLTRPPVTRKDLEAREQKFELDYDKFCTNKQTPCSSGERCFYNRRFPVHDSSGKGVTIEKDDLIAGRGAECVCMPPFGRGADGKCTNCHGNEVQDEHHVAKRFNNGEHHCAPSGDEGSIDVKALGNATTLLV